jgi:hypothetical protein
MPRAAHAADRPLALALCQPEIVATEARLASLDWFGPAPPALEIVTGANDQTEVEIEPSRLRWVRFLLSDGSAARLVETLDVIGAGEASAGPRPSSPAVPSGIRPA